MLLSDFKMEVTCKCASWFELEIEPHRGSSFPPSHLMRETKGRNPELSWAEFTRKRNEIRKQTVTALATILITKIYKKRAIYIQKTFSLTHRSEPLPHSSWNSNKNCLPDPLHAPFPSWLQAIPLSLWKWGFRGSTPSSDASGVE